jgi:hypothetical protein
MSGVMHLQAAKAILEKMLGDQERKGFFRIRSGFKSRTALVLFKTDLRQNLFQNELMFNVNYAIEASLRDVQSYIR